MTGAELREARVRLGYTQSALAEALGVSTPSVSRLEDAEEVPDKHVQVLLRLPPLAAGGRGPYRAGKQSQARKPAPAARPRPRAPVSGSPAQLPAPTPAEERVYEPGELGEVEVGGLWLAALLLLGIHRHLEARRLEEEVEAAFARIHVRTPRVQPPRPQPPPLPKLRRVRPCWRCGSWS